MISGPLYHVGQKVEIQSDGKWMAGRIISSPIQTSVSNGIKWCYRVTVPVDGRAVNVSRMENGIRIPQTVEAS